MIKNPVMFMVEVGSAFTTALFLHALATGAGDAPPAFILAVSLWLWFTVIFANFAEAMDAPMTKELRNVFIDAYVQALGKDKAATEAAVDADAIHQALLSERFASLESDVWSLEKS